MINITDTIEFNDKTNEIIHGNSILKLTEKEGRLLTILYEFNGDVVSRDRLITQIWPERELGITDANLLQLICKLRCKLRHCGLSEVVTTVYRQGYSLTLPIHNEDVACNQELTAASPCPPQKNIFSTTFNGRGGLFKIIFILCLYLTPIIPFYYSIPHPYRSLITILVSMPRLKSLNIEYTTQGYMLDYQIQGSQQKHKHIISL
ncbi:winged helix-turn-helix domain-containing protein [Klebsiella michiganensis]|jgi:DNA-binding winged helix-turn-helix (wHTH) protein|uniref:winged helix-turn-helix domain-containing protein n=1 Tax=Klebsiella michiganensis TaxID=1134687 RepID=UPI002570D09F|nr:winged helix-turn-helix domain-containing protein [Klebsiella michiganensis]MDL4454989.1 winged helix-turn-helix domain-containing protein [Klebsiella michiganensis]